MRGGRAGMKKERVIGDEDDGEGKKGRAKEMGDEGEGKGR